MSLADLEIATTHIPYGSGGFAVRGLGFNDLLVLFRAYGARLDELKAMGTGQIDAHAIIARFPDIVAHAIALAANEPAQIEKVAALPAGVQIKAALAVWGHTVEDAGGIDHLLGEVMAAIEGARKGVGSLSSLTMPSTGYNA